MIHLASGYVSLNIVSLGAHLIKHRRKKSAELEATTTAAEALVNVNEVEVESLLQTVPMFLHKLFHQQ